MTDSVLALTSCATTIIIAGLTLFVALIGD